MSADSAISRPPFWSEMADGMFKFVISSVPADELVVRGHVQEQ